MLNFVHNIIPMPAYERGLFVYNDVLDGIKWKRAFKNDFSFF